MPKSKRAKVVHLSKVDKKGKEHTEKLYNGIREAADAYQHIFVFSVDNMRNTYLKDVRAEFQDSRIFFGKTKVMAVALGRNPESEHLPGLASLSQHLTGNVGLLFTSRSPSDILSYFSTYSETDFARAGIRATQTFTVPAGIVHSTGGMVPAEEDDPLPHSLEPELRRWGMPTRLDKGKVKLDEDYEVCREGQVLDSRQTALLKKFGIHMAEFKIRILAYWSSETQEVTEVDEEAMDQE